MIVGAHRRRGVDGFRHFEGGANSFAVNRAMILTRRFGKEIMHVNVK